MRLTIADTIKKVVIKLIITTFIYKKLKFNNYNTLISFNTSFVARTAAALLANNAASSAFSL